MQLPLLKELNVAKNLLKSLFLPIYLSSLHILDLRANQIANIKEDDLDNLRNTKLSNLSLILSQNPLTNIVPGSFRSISLHMLHLKGCFSSANVMESNLKAMSGLFVEKLVIGHYRNYLKTIDLKSERVEGLCNMNIEELTITGMHFSQNTFHEYPIEVPNLEFLDLSRNVLNIDKCCLQISDGISNLLHLNLSYNRQVVLYSVFLNLSHLQSLDFSHTELTNVGVYPIFVLMDKLIYLDLSNTKSHFSIQCSFCGLYSLQVLKVSHSVFETNILASVFKDLKELRLLDMSSCGLIYIPVETFASLKLLQKLDLSNNKLLELQGSVLNPLNDLTILNVSSNSFPSLSSETTQFISQNLSEVDLSNNPFDCSCNQMPFLLWVYEQSNRRLRFSNSLKCQTPEYLQGTQLSEVNLICNLTIYVCFGVFVVITAIAGGMFYCYKQKYFHLCYLLQTHNNHNVEKEYDAFVIHSSLDEEWVKEHLVPKLEDGAPRFQLCLHYRDFIPGIPITTNIVNEGIRRSRKALIIVSQNFIESKWCSFEFEMVMSWQFLESQCGIIVILLEAVNMAHLKHMLGLNKYLRKNTYLKWVDGYVERKVFWRRLREALQKGDESKLCAPQLDNNNGDVCEEQNEHNRMKL
ncbi:hypothetical protein GDO81_003702 [Engystomops pustulosus]|nr:hypothetical protein GDO81_003702 [Engystomops pustulosus]